MKYDYLIVGSGLFGSVFAYEANRLGKKVLIIDKRDTIAGNIYTKKVENITVHQYGAHIFHTNKKNLWEYVNYFAEFNRYTNSPIAIYQNEIYNLPFNMNTFYQMWGVITPAEAKERIRQQVEQAGITQPRNLEEQAIALVGLDIYEKLIKGYTAKQWGKPCCELPPFLIKRLPVRFTYDNNYFNDMYQGIPMGGYTQIVERMIEGIDIELNVDFTRNRNELQHMANRIIYTGMIDEYFECCFGAMDYRSLRFETEMVDVDNYQGNAVVNYTEYHTPYTRIIEHKHFEPENSVAMNHNRTVITKEYPATWERGLEAYYPMNNQVNDALCEKYMAIAKEEKNIVFGGRLGSYKYLNMDQTVEAALALVKSEFS